MLLWELGAGMSFLGLLGWNAIQKFKTSQIFQPYREETPAPPRWDKITLRTHDGEHLCAWYYRHPQQDVHSECEDKLNPVHLTGSYTGCVLYCHGNSGNMNHHWPYVRDLTQYFSVLIFDYRGFGSSSGQPSEEGLVDDAYAAWKFLRQVAKIPAQHILVYGHSLGGAVATSLVSRLQGYEPDLTLGCGLMSCSSSFEQKLRRPPLDHSPGALILSSTFSSVADAAPRFLPSWLRVLVAREFRSHEILGDPCVPMSECPILILHSHSDEILPFSPHAEKLIAACRQAERQYLHVEIRGTHNEPFYPSPLHHLTHNTSHPLFLIHHLRRVIPRPSSTASQ